MTCVGLGPSSSKGASHAADEAIAADEVIAAPRAVEASVLAARPALLGGGVYGSAPAKLVVITIASLGTAWITSSGNAKLDGELCSGAGSWEISQRAGGDQAENIAIRGDERGSYLLRSEDGGTRPKAALDAVAQRRRLLPDG